jgi:hypothetical protein
MMNFGQPPRSAVLSDTSYERGRWSWQRAARGAWIAFALVLLVIFVVNIPAFFQYAGRVCTLTDAGYCPTEQLTPAYVQILDQLHLSVTLTQVLLATLCIVVSILYGLMGVLIFLRKSHETMGLLVSLLLVMFASSGFLGFNLPAQTPPLFQYLAEIITYGLMWPAMLVFFFTFPTGRFTPRWTWGAFVPFFVVTMIGSIPVTEPFVPNIALILTSLLPIGVQIYRYTHIYDSVQKQQVKWFVFCLSVIFLLTIIQGVFLAMPGSNVTSLAYQLFNGPFWLLLWTILFLGVSVPILRYRLWDIDTIINRALVYGTLSAILTVSYVGLIFALQSLTHALTGLEGDQPVVIVGSTLLIAALFQPLRQRLQQVIDRRFYRRKYDAQKTLAAFSSTLRGEVDLDQLCEHVLAVVEETMQPTSLSLWIRPLKQQRTASGIRGESPPHFEERPGADQANSR